jgi:hypothetical protein
MLRNFTHEVNALFHIKGRQIRLSVPCYMTFQPPCALQVQKAWFNPDTQKIEIEAVIRKRKERVAFSSVFISES